MPSVTTRTALNGVEEQGKGQPIVFSHGWPLSADDWDAQLLFFLGKGYRVIAHDRRGHGQSTQVADGHDMDHYADDLAAVVAHLDLTDAIHVGHSTGGGEVVHYIARHGESPRIKGRDHQRGTAADGADGGQPERAPQKSIRRLSGGARGQSLAVLSRCRGGPLLQLQQDRQACRGDYSELVAAGHDGRRQGDYDGIVAFSQTDFTEDLKKISVAVLVMHSEADQIVPYVAAGPLSAKLLKNGTLKTYTDFPHGMPTTQAETINADLLAFLRG